LESADYQCKLFFVVTTSWHYESVEWYVIDTVRAPGFPPAFLLDGTNLYNFPAYDWMKLFTVYGKLADLWLCRFGLVPVMSQSLEKITAIVHTFKD
jgi:hypothetical protein